MYVIRSSSRMHVMNHGNPVALCDRQHAGKEIVTRPKSEYFANDPESRFTSLHTAVTQGRRIGGMSHRPPVCGVTSTSTPALWPCTVLWPCTFCSDRIVRIYLSKLNTKLYVTYYSYRAPFPDPFPHPITSASRPLSQILNTPLNNNMS